MSDTKWSEVERQSAENRHRSELESLRNELEHTRATLARVKAARAVKLPAPRATSKRRADDLVRVIIPDTHGCKADRGAIAALLADVKTLNPHHVVLLGDHVDCGGFLAQNHVMGYVAETAYSYEDDIEHANGFIDALQKAAPSAQIEYVEGNHERRVETWCVTQTLRHSKDADRLRELYAPEYRLRLAARGISYFRQGVFYDGLPVPGVIKRGKFFFFHGVSTSKNAVAATQGRIGGNCVFGHTHRAQSEISRQVGTGTIGAWNPGCLCELQPLWQHTQPTNWTHGYAVQLVSKSGDFLHLNVPIVNGASNFAALFRL